MTSITSARRAGGWWVWGACYLALVSAIVWSLFYARQRALVELATPGSVGDWQAWREDVKQQAEEAGPVERRIPRSAEPPALVLLRDFFGVSLGGAVLFSTVLYWIMAWLVTGALAPPTVNNSSVRTEKPNR